MSTTLSLISTDDGTFVPHMSACVLAVDDGARLLSGFFDGWGSVVAQLAELVESG